MTNTRPKVGLAVFVTSKNHPGCILLGRRKNSLGAGHFAPPGGHLEYGESFEECGRRETLEETGLTLKHVHLDRVVNGIWREEHYHYVIIVLRAEVDLDYQNEPLNLEPHKCDGWHWFDWSDLPAIDQRFRPLQIILEDGYCPFPPPAEET